MSIPEAIPEDLDLGQGKSCRIYRCPTCNRWDYAIQGEPLIDVDLGTYVCGHCGTDFQIKETTVPYSYNTPLDPEDQKALDKALLGILCGVGLLVLAVLTAILAATSK